MITVELDLFDDVIYIEDDHSKVTLVVDKELIIEMIENAGGWNEFANE